VGKTPIIYPHFAINVLRLNDATEKFKKIANNTYSNTRKIVDKT
jgi:hypothetical protein